MVSFLGYADGRNSGFSLNTQSWTVRSWSERKSSQFQQSVFFGIWLPNLKDNKIILADVTWTLWVSGGYVPSYESDSHLLHHGSTLKEKLIGNMLILIAEVKSKRDWAKLHKHILKFLIIVTHFNATKIPLAKESHIERFNIPGVRKYPSLGKENVSICEQ